MNANDAAAEGGNTSIFTTRNIWIAVIVAVMVMAGYTVTKRNSFVRQEIAITASYDANKATLDKITQTIQGSGLAADKYGDIVIKAITAAMTGRYGPEGSKAAMQWIQENQPNIDPAIFNKLQQVIEANYAEWASAQITLRDRVRVYETDTQEWPGALVAGALGYPRKGFDIALYKRMIATDDTNDAFKTGKMKGVGDLINKK